MKIVIGQGSCGIAAGALKIEAAIKNELLHRNISIDISAVGCIGMCFLEPIVDFLDNDGNKRTFVRVSESNVSNIISSVFDGSECTNEIEDKDRSFLSKQTRITLRNCGLINPSLIDEYIDTGGYDAFKNCLSMSPNDIIEEIKKSGLAGRGGAGFPTWFKWQTAHNMLSDKKYMICNADEGDPGAFMDRSILEGDPHSLIEGMLIGAYAIGAAEGIVYVRAEYPLAISRLTSAIDAAYERGFLGSNILDSNFNFDLYIKAGAGAFVCGEETALIASLEGERGMPRFKPPFPAIRGLWQKPTNINNVETYANVPWIIANGSSAFSSLGTDRSKGTKVFALTGKIKNGGLVEIPMGISIRDVVYDIGGGIKNDRALKAIQMGGPSGGCIPVDLIDTVIDYRSLADTGAIMGSGGMVVVDETTCMVDMARFFLDFTCNESCGKCVQCRIGTKRMLEILNRIVSGNGVDGDIELLEDLGSKIKEGALCALGQTAPNPVLTTIKYFREEYEAHIYDKKCPSKQCKPLLTFTIDKGKCVGCTLCANKCPVSAIVGERKAVHEIIQDKCIKCGKCYENCKFDAVMM